MPRPFYNTKAAFYSNSVIFAKYFVQKILIIKRIEQANMTYNLSTDNPESVLLNFTNASDAEYSSK
jgi:hypothetical protein